MALTPEQIRAIADKAEARARGVEYKPPAPPRTVPSIRPPARSVSECTDGIRAIIDRAEREDKPFVRHPLIQQVKEFANMVDAWVEQEKRLKK